MNDLNIQAIEAALKRYASAIGHPLYVLASTGSTNDDAREAANEGAPSGTVIVADTQSAGRGRGTHTWHSPSGENVYVSIVLRPKLDTRRVSAASLVVGVCVARVIERRLHERGRERVKLKWPNDVWVDEKKIGGVLIEGRLRGESVQHLVVGVGVNIKTRVFPLELRDKATSLSLLGCEDVDRADVLGELLAEIGRGMLRYEREGLEAFRQELEHKDGLKGKRVKVGDRVGVARGIDGEGCVMVERETGFIEKVSSGELFVLDGEAEGNILARPSKRW